MRYLFIRDLAGEFGVRRLCRVMRVSSSAWYAWQKRPVVTSPDDVGIRVRLKALFAASRTLVKKFREEGATVSRWRVMKLMQEEDWNAVSAGLIKSRQSLVQEQKLRPTC